MIEANALLTAGGTESGNLIVSLLFISFEYIIVETSPIIIAGNNPFAPR